MKKCIYILLLITFFPIINYAGEKNADYYYTLLPVAQQLEQGKGKFIFSSDVKIYYSAKNPDLSDYFHNFLKLSGLDLSLIRLNKLQKFEVLISSASNEKLETDIPALKDKGDEAYKLTITGKAIHIYANSSLGIYWGLVTLLQLIENKENGQSFVPLLNLMDWPRYRWRGYMLDTGRAPYSVAQIKRIIRICSAFKLNFLIIREGDDELNAFRFKNLPLGSDNPYALTLEDFMNLIAYGKKFGLSVFPEIESLGHIESKKKFYPQLVQGGIREDYWPGFYHTRKANLDINNQETYELLEAMYDEIFPLLSIPMVHLGLDEVRLSKTDQTQHLKKLLPIAGRVGRKYDKDVDILVWSDAPPTPKEYQDKVIRCLWRYSQEVLPEADKLVRQGAEELLKENCRQRVFMAGGSGTHHKPYSKDSYAGAFTNLYSWAKLGENHANFIGIYAVQWATNTIDRWIPDFLMAADFGWNVPKEKPDYNRYMKKIATRLRSIGDFIQPEADEIPRPAWDAIWLDGDYWGEDILSGEKAAPKITIEPSGGYFSKQIGPVRIFSSVKDAKIFYTTDGSVPNRNSNLYLEPLMINSMCSIKAVGYAPERAPGYVEEVLFIDSSFQRPAKISKNLQHGISYRYYENKVRAAVQFSDKTPVKIGRTNQIRLGKEGNGIEEFGYIFSGYLSVPARGKYTFYLLSNDGSRLYINGNEVINNDGRHAAEEKSVKLSLEKGLYPIELKYFQYGGGKALQLLWQGPGIVKSEVAPKYFFTKEIKS
jgi:hypothetical protein